MNRIKGYEQPRAASSTRGPYNTEESPKDAGDKRAGSPAAIASFSEKSRILAEKTGVERDMDTPYLLSKESDAKLSPFGEFLRVQTNRPDKHEDFLREMAEKYAGLRDDIINHSEAEKDDIDRQLSELDSLFKSFIGNGSRKPLQPMEQTGIYLSYDEAGRKLNEEIIKAKKEHRNNIESITENFSGNMARHVDKFYNSFIAAIKDKDFESAFDESMALLKGTETTSFKNISYDDMQNIMDVIRNTATEFDENGVPTKYRYASTTAALRALCADDRIPELVRDAVSKILG